MFKLEMEITASTMTPAMQSNLTSEQTLQSGEARKFELLWSRMEPSPGKEFTSLTDVRPNSTS